MAQPVAEQRRPVALVLHYIHANVRNDVLLKLPGYREMMEEMKVQLISSGYKVIVKEFDETEEAGKNARVLGSKIRGVFSKFSGVKDVWGVEEQEVVVKNLVIWRAKQYFSQRFQVPGHIKNDLKKKNINLSFVCLGRVSQGERQAFTQCLQGRTDNPQEWKHWDSTLPPCLLTGFGQAPRASTSTSGVAPPGLEASIVGASGSTSVSGTTRSLPATSNLANAASLARGYLAYPIQHSARPVHPRAVSLQRYVHPTGHHPHSLQRQIALPSLYPRQHASMLPVEYPDYAEPSIPGLRKRARANTEPPSPVKHCRTELQAVDPSADEFPQWIDMPEGQYGYYAEASGFITPPLSISTSEASTSSDITPPLELGVANVATPELDALSYNTSVSQWHLQLAQASNNAPGAVFHEAGNPFSTTHTEHQAGYHDEGFLSAGLAQLDEVSSVASEERIAWNDKGKGKAVPVNYNAHLARSPEIPSNTITHSYPQALKGQSAVVSPQISVPSLSAAEECALHATVETEQSQVHFGGETIPKSAAHPLLSQYHGDLLDLMLSYRPDPPSDNSPPPPVNAADCQQGDGGILQQVISGDDNGMVGGSSISRQTFVDITGGDKVASGSGTAGQYATDDADHTLPCVDRSAIVDACRELIELSSVNPQSPVLFEFLDWLKTRKTGLCATKHVQTELLASEQHNEEDDVRGETVASGNDGAEKLSEDSAETHADEGNENTYAPPEKEIEGTNASTGECSENAGPELHDDSGNVCLTTFASDVVENSEKLITDAIVGPSFAENERSAETADDVRHEGEEDESENQAKGEEQEEHQDEVVREDHDQDGDEGNREDDGLSGACHSGDIISLDLLTLGILEAFPGLDDDESGYL